MAPVGVEDVKRVVVDIEPAPAKAGGIGFFRSMWCSALTSHTGACARPTRTRNKPWVTLVLARYSSARSCLRCPAGQSDEVGVFERLIRSGQRPPPHPEPARIMAHSEIRVQDNAIDAIVTAAQQILIESAQPVCHGRQVTGTLPPASNCPAGATFSQPGLRKSVGR